MLVAWPSWQYIRYIARWISMSWVLRMAYIISYCSVTVRYHPIQDVEILDIVRGASAPSMISEIETSCIG